ncbi:MAG: hypothetical protein ACE5I7_06360 [Candidatus Binatia bacterium]
MASPVPAALAGKAKRVGGTFVLMIGAGIMLDTHAVWVGVPLMVVGATVFGWGMAALGEDDASAETRERPP